MRNRVQNENGTLHAWAQTCRLLLSVVGLLLLLSQVGLAAEWTSPAYHAGDKLLGAPFLDLFRSLDPGPTRVWQWLDPLAPNNWTIVPQGLQLLVTESSGLLGPGPSLDDHPKLQNVLLLTQRIGPDQPFIMETKVTFLPQNNFEDACLVVMKADSTGVDNFLALGDAYANWTSIPADLHSNAVGHSIYFDAERSGGWADSNLAVYNHRHPIVVQDWVPKTVWLRVVRLFVPVFRFDGGRYEGWRQPRDPSRSMERDSTKTFVQKYEVYYAQYSKNGRSWNTVGTHVITLGGDVQVGIAVWNSNQGPPSPTASAVFEYFGLALLKSTWEFQNYPPGKPTTLAP
jgi:hypothetical protein